MASSEENAKKIKIIVSVVALLAAGAILYFQYATPASPDSATTPAAKSTPTADGGKKPAAPGGTKPIRTVTYEREGGGLKAPGSGD